MSQSTENHRCSLQSKQLRLFFEESPQKNLRDGLVGKLASATFKETHEMLAVDKGTLKAGKYKWKYHQ